MKFRATPIAFVFYETTLLVRRCQIVKTITSNQKGVVIYFEQLITGSCLILKMVQKQPVEISVFTEKLHSILQISFKMELSRARCKLNLNDLIDSLFLLFFSCLSIMQMKTVNYIGVNSSKLQ